MPRGRRNGPPREAKAAELEKMEELYPPYCPQEITPIEQVRANPHVGVEVSTAERILSIRYHGGLIFAHLMDDGYKLQIVLMRDRLGEDRFQRFKNLYDEGDFVWVRGEVFYTKRGELTVRVSDYKMMAKALRDLPGKYGHALKNTEQRYRRRHLDILLNPRSRTTFEIRFHTIQEIRRFLWRRGFIEVETPILQPVYGGAAANPFITRIDVVNEEWYLRISPELYLKRYIIAGVNKVFEIGSQFRNEDIDVTHNPEFTSLEVYQAWADYNDMMTLTEQLISTVARKVTGRWRITYPVDGENREINLEPPWPRIAIYEALKIHASIEVEGLKDDDIQQMLEEYDVRLRGGYSRGIAIAKIFDKCVVPKLVQPTFITDYPRETTPLCKPHRSKEGLIERFELFIGGMELANAYTELNDPRLQEKFFREAEQRLRGGEEEGHPYDWEFVEALKYGMPPTGGLGIGVDRLVMLLTGHTSIKEVIPFPILRRIAPSQAR